MTCELEDQVPGLTFRPLVDGMSSVAGQTSVQVFQQDVELIVHVDEEGISSATGSPRVTANTCVAIVSVKCLLFRPGSVSVCPAYGVKRRGIFGIP